MTLAEIVRRIRGRSHQGEDAERRKRAFLDARRGSLDGWTERDLDELTRRSIEGREEEIQRALNEADEHRRQRGSHR